MAIAEAQKLLDSGDLEGAKELLLRVGFIEKDDPAVQEAYYRLIPAGQALQTRLDGVLQQLHDGDQDSRAKAAAAIAKEAARAVNAETHAWICDPRVTDHLKSAMIDGKAKLVKEAAGAAILIIHRYFADVRLREPFVALLKNRNKTLRRHACNAIVALHHPEVVALLTPMLADQADEVRGQVCVLLGTLAQKNQLDETRRTALLPAVIGLLEDDGVAVRDHAAATLRKFGDPAALDALRAALERETIPLVRDTLSDAIAALS